MQIQDMHYDFKQKLNKIDSQLYRNLKIQEIDWKLNEGMEVFIKTIAEPRYSDALGVEVNQRLIDELYSIVKERQLLTITPFGDNKSYIAALPVDYWFLLDIQAIASKGSCIGIELKTNERRHDDQPEDSPFDDSNFEWGETNFRFFNGGVRFFTDGTFSIDKIYLDYLIHPPYIHYAAGVIGGQYKMPNGTLLTGTQDCILPQGTHREIVDMAVLITTGDLNMSDYQIKMAKLKLND